MSLLHHIELLRTVQFAALKHKHQRRKDATGTPYINHPIGVAQLIAEVGKVTDLTVLQAALLHDTIEDTDTTYEELEKNFGSKVANVVREVTDDKSLPKAVRKQQQIIHAAHASYEAKVVKLGDKLYNLLDLLQNAPLNWPVDVIQGYFVWVRKVVDGIRGTNEGLEAALDEVFKSNFTHPATGKTYPCIPNCDLDKFLEEYYAKMN